MYLRPSRQSLLSRTYHGHTGHAWHMLVASGPDGGARRRSGVCSFHDDGIHVGQRPDNATPGVASSLDQKECPPHAYQVRL